MELGNQEERESRYGPPNYNVMFRASFLEKDSKGRKRGNRKGETQINRARD